MRSVLSPRLAVCAELFTVSRKQYLFAVSVADLTRETDCCLFLKTQHSVRHGASVVRKSASALIGERAGHWTTSFQSSLNQGPKC